MDLRRDPAPVISCVISCDECVMRRTSACADCVVTFVVDDLHPPGGPTDALTFDVAEERAVRLLADAGLIPELRYRAAS
jgi:hypothetical protein